MTTPDTEPYYAQQHAQAVAEGRDYYIDERSGLLVFTALFLGFFILIKQ